MIGELIDHYRVLELVGRGAMGVVYKAVDVNLDRQVALKVMSAEVRDDPDFVERFHQEARMQAALNHPNIALLFDYFVHAGVPVAVMEFIQGESMEQMIRRRAPVPARDCIPLFKQALQGVAAAHRAGIVHRDLKPSNLMVTPDGIVKVMDFGIAKRQGVTGATKFSSTSIGSPLYMAPEQILGRAVDRRTDIYALGIVLYELLTGQRPFNARGKAEYLILDAHVNELPEPPTVYRYGIPQPIVDAVMRALAKNPEERFQCAEDFMRALPDPGAAPAAGAAQGAAAAPNPEPAPDVVLLPDELVLLPDAESPDALTLVPESPAPRVGPTGTLALAPERPLTLALAPEPPLTLAHELPAVRVGPTGTVALRGAPPPERQRKEADGTTGTIVIDHVPTRQRDPSASMSVDFSANTVWQQLHPPPSAPSPRAETVSATPAPAAHESPESTRVPRARRSGAPAMIAVVLATLAFGALIRYGGRLHATKPVAQVQAPTATVPAESTEPPAPAAEPLPPAVAPAADTTLAATAPTRQDLSGTWSGEYTDASGKQLLRVVNLSISSVRADGGIEGTLEYQAASGNGECKLHPRGSNWSAPDRRLQLSPEGCSPHYPRELGVPLDFAGVNPRGNTLKDGRIEAPTGDVIRVRLKRVI